MMQRCISTAALAMMLSLANHATAGTLGYFTAFSTSPAQSLYSIDLANPGIVTTIGAFSGAVNAIDGLDFRPANGLLYGYQFSTNSLVTINPLTAFTTLASVPTTGSISINLGIDFNPVADRLRIVNQADQNLRVNVDTGATLVDGTLAYAAADPNFGVGPQIIEAAYTNSDTNPATGTSLYYIDNALNALVTTTSPNAGVLNTVGSLGVNTGAFVGFDILSDGFGGNAAYAIMDVAGVSSLYDINLATGAATSIGAIGPIGSTPFGLAIVQPAVPEPGTAAIALGLATCGLVINRRRRVL